MGLPPPLTRYFNMEFPKWFVPTFAILLTLLSFAFLGYSVFGPELSEGAQRMADTVNGFLMGSVLSSIVGVIFGTSLGSKQGRAALDKVMDKLTDKVTKVG